jgi:phospholipid-translocating ATPase
VPFYSTLVPLVGVLAVTAVKDAYDDVKRHVSDLKINNRAAYRVHSRDADVKHQQLRWKNVKVGDVLRLENNAFITVSVSSLQYDSRVF